VGIIGAGAVLKRNALAYLRLPELARLVAVSDIDGGRAEAARKLYGMQAAYENYDELLARDDVHVVGICTRPNLHPRLVIDAVRAGKHVLCEKPIAQSLEGADEIIAACEQHPESQVSCLYQWRRDPAVMMLNHLVEQDHLGRVVMADVHLRAWRDDSYYQGGGRESWAVDGGGVLIVIAIHQIDMILSLLGDPVEVSARMDTTVKPSEAEDTLVAWVRFDSGALATIRCTICDQENRFAVEILGERARVGVRGGGGIHNCEWEVHARDAATERSLREIARQRAPHRGKGPGPLAVRVLERLSRLRGRPWLPPSRWWHTPFVRHFLEAVLSGGPAPVPPREARRSLELVTAIYQSAITGSSVRLPLDSSSPLYSGVTPDRPLAQGE
jgi:predicted dehydrogenase